MESWDALFKALAELRERWPGSAQEWTYDRRLKCVTSSIPLTREADARAAMTGVLPTVWSVDTLPGGKPVGRGGFDPHLHRQGRGALPLELPARLARLPVVP